MPNIPAEEKNEEPKKPSQHKDLTAAEEVSAILGFNILDKEYGTQRLELAKTSKDALLLTALCDSKEYPILQALALNNHTPLAVLKKIAASRDAKTKEYLISRIPEIASEVICAILEPEPQLATGGLYWGTEIDAYKRLRKLVINAYKEKIPENVEVLIEKTKERVRGYEGEKTVEELAADPSTSGTLLEDLAHIGTTGTRQKVALHVNINKSIADFFLGYKQNISDPSKRHDATVVQNPNFPQEMYEKVLQLDSLGKYFLLLNPKVHNTEIFNRLVKQGLNSGEKDIDTIVGLDVDYPAWVCDTIYKKGGTALIALLKCNSHLSIDFLEKLSSDTSAKIRGWVATHQNTPHHILEKLAQDKNNDVKTIAQERLQS